jgi:hypothetical protein
MYRKLLFLTFMMIAFIGLEQKAEAQKVKQLGHPPIPIKTNERNCTSCCTCDPPNNNAAGTVPLTCNTPTPADSSICASLDANGDVNVNYSITTDEYIVDSQVFILNNEIFTNKTSCNMNFVACAMVSYQAPYNVVHTSPKYGENLNQWVLTQNTCDTCSTGCNYTCSDFGNAFDETWSYYFGCQDINLAPGQSISVFSGAHAIGSPIVAYPNGFDSVTEPVTLSQYPYVQNNTDTTISTWNFNGMYIDFLKGCEFSSISGCDFGNEAGQELSQYPANGTCIKPEWYWNGQILKSYHGGIYPTAIVTFPVGNQATTTMADTNNAHTVYRAEFVGYIAGAPAGSELFVYAPEDTSGGLAVIDSGFVWADTLVDCQSDTLRFEFPFIIPPMSYSAGGMSFVLQFPPNSCSNVGNGKRIYLNGSVMANATTPLYDSGTYMYNTVGVVVLDTTPPHVAAFSINEVDSTRLAILLTGIDDTTVVDKGYVIYSLNGGPNKVKALRYANSLAVGDTTTFVDTLVTTMSHPSILIKGFVGNQVGLLDSSTINAITLYSESPQSVTEGNEDSVRVNYLSIDHQSKVLTLDMQADGAPIELDLVTEDGRSSKLTSESSSPDGEQKFILPLSNFASGPYFLVVRSGNDSIIENIIL